VKNKYISYRNWLRLHYTDTILKFSVSVLALDQVNKTQ